MVDTGDQVLMDGYETRSAELRSERTAVNHTQVITAIIGFRAL